MLRIGPYSLKIGSSSRRWLVTDRPFRKLCRELGAGYAISEMVASKPELADPQVNAAHES